ncbi:MAG TPA: trypsin-like peptidase domain-containing protein, partial [Casimicrobiaceae bacterium]|nr:trypsin-like peptidase domain-containing protein [Casimicrobiaceae bacterium]
ALAEAWGKWIVAIALLAGIAWWGTSLREPTAPSPHATQVTPPTVTGAVTPPTVTGAVTPPTVTAAVTPPTVTGAVTPPAVAATVTPPVAAEVTPPAPSVATAPIQKSAETLFADVASSVARVNVMDASGRLVGSGSGVVIDDGVLLTSCHVATVGAKLTAKLGESVLPATVALADEVYDLCRLNVPGMRAPPVPIGSVDTLRTGQRVYAIGAPQGLELTLSEGIVSALRKVDGGTVIQTTAPISPGSSGGGLFDASGRLVGVMTFQHRYGQNLNFALPADWIPQMRARRATQPGWRSSAVADQSQIGSPLALLVGRWLCRDWTTGRTGHYSFETDGRVSIAMSDTRDAATLRYGVSGKTLQIGDAKQAFSMAIEEIGARKLILRGRERSIACERE